MKLLKKLAVILFPLILISVFSNDIPAQKRRIVSVERYVLPFDGAKKDASFLVFRNKLIAAVKRRDKKYLFGIIDPSILNDFGGSGGSEEFKAIWKIADPKTTFWDEFLLVLTNGGNFHGGKNAFCAPYVYTSFPDDLNSFDYETIFGKNVALRARPTSKAETIANLSYNIVKPDYDNSVKIKNTENTYSWVKVTTLGGKTGFVKENFVRSAIDYRVCFDKSKGKWKMTAFIAGD